LGLKAQPINYLFKHLDSNNGLSSNQINTIFKDSKGYIWIGTVNGLNRFDGYSIKVFHKAKKNPETLTDNNIASIYEDFRGILWITTGSGLNFFDPVTELFSTDDPLLHKNIPLPNSNIVGLHTDAEKNLWLVHRTDGIYKYDQKKDKVDHYAVFGENKALQITDFEVSPNGAFWWITNSITLQKFDPIQFKVVATYADQLQSIPQNNANNQLLIDGQNNIWIYSRSESEGAFCFDIKKGSITHFHAESDQFRITHNMIAAATLDLQGNVWLGTDHGGINVINPITRTVTPLLNDPGSSQSLSQNSITSLMKDDNGIIWAGTYKKGVNYYHPNLFRFSAYTLNPYRKSWLTNDDVNTFAEDAKGNLWIGTNGGGLIYFDRVQNTFKTYKHDPKNPNSLSNDVIVDICLDRLGGLWIGTYVGGLNYFDGQRFVRYQNNPANKSSLSNNNVWSIIEDKTGKIWIGTLGGGIDQFDRSTNSFLHVGERDIVQNNSDYIMSMSESKTGDIWFATYNGIRCYNKTDHMFQRFYHAEEANNSLSSNTTLDIFSDSRGWAWVATREGLDMYNPETKEFRSFTREHGLPDNSILTILETNDGNLWLATPQGLSNLMIEKDKNGVYTFSFKNYDEKDGLHGRVFNEHAALKTRKGELVFGGPTGFTIFDPAKLQVAEQTPEIVFTKFQVENKSVEIGQELNNRVLLHQSLNTLKEIKLKHFEKTFSVTFAALNYLNPEKIVYHYQLEGFNDDWVVTTADSREVTYTNLSPNEYVLKVYASNLSNTLKSEVIALKINILPPFWRTKWAYSFYLIFTLIVIFYTIKSIIERERNKFLIQQERLETAKIHEMDMLKLKFFTNIGHEFRTPLTLILSPLEKIIRTTESGQNKEQLKLVQRNAKRLLNLVNQLLDFRRLEVQGLTLEIRKGEIVQFCRDAVESFSDLSETRNIELNFSTNIKELSASFDYDKIEKIIFNLLSNAFKFTPEKGKIQFKVMAEEGINNEKWLMIEVIDTGIGIPLDKQELIFERFVQNVPEGVIVNKGSGIGLSLTREFVQMHEGTISVESTPGQGSCFRVVLPLKEQFKLQNISQEIISNKLDFSKPDISEKLLKEEHAKGLKLPRLLLVEDNPDIRFYLKDNLKTDYNIVEAENGVKAWDVILDDLPDLIVSDIMMPEMDGIELCRKIKTDHRTSHIPVILLTARTSDHHQSEGLETGADDYITKPFNFEVLELRMKNLIQQRELLRARFQKNFDLEPTEISITSLDDKFLKKVKDITEKNMHEPNFSVEKLSSDIGISRAHLYNKLLSLTGKTPIEYIRILRIRRAAQLLVKSQLTVMEIAYKVGFNDPRYFTKHFKSEYNMTPSQYIKQYGNNERPEIEL
jgi:signal transduction histidine kinase/ligand-binding sensor domain-containing protein/DNA-binding response OmpR family regulator